MHMPWLSLAIWVPILFGVVTLVLGRNARDGLARVVALVGAIVSFVVTIPVMTLFQSGTAKMQFVENHTWVSSINASYALCGWFVDVVRTFDRFCNRARDFGRLGSDFK